MQIFTVSINQHCLLVKNNPQVPNMFYKLNLIKNKIYVCYIFYYLSYFILKKKRCLEKIVMIVKWVIGSISCIKHHVISNKYLKYTISVNISNQDFV